MGMKTLRSILTILIIAGMCMASVSSVRAAQASPSGFHGSLHVNGITVPGITGHSDTAARSGSTAAILTKGFTCTVLDSKPTPVTTGEKPQSKVWTYDGSWFAVFPTTLAGASSAGTWVWKLVGTTWTEALKLSSRTDTHADVLVDGSLAHILLWAGTNTQFSSIEYAGSTYQLWATRNTPVNLSLPGSETATIALDSTGEMWLATRSGSVNIVVYHSAPPYSSWAGPIVLETGVNGDDIEVITALPNGTVGVFWSNQNVRRFGFRYHVDGEAATTWSVNEVPASQSALNVGDGMADDHMNLAVASDSTLYVAIKTSYDTSGYPKMALLVRHPDGTWDDLYPVDTAGTRPLVLLDENNASLNFIYTASEGTNQIVYKQSSTRDISFDGRKTLRTGSYNDVSSMKTNIEDSFVVIYSNDSVVAGQYCSMDTGVYADLAITNTGGIKNVLPGDIRTNTITAINNGPDPVVNAIVTDAMTAGLNAITWTCSGAGGGTCTASGTSIINDTVNLPSGASVTYTIQAEVAPGASGSFTNTASITAPTGTTDPLPGNNSASYTYTVAGNQSCEADSTLVGCWQMEENGGSVLLDGSSNANNATLYGAPAWSAGKVGDYAIDLNGTSQYALVPDNSSLDIANQITITAWIRPEQYATQDLIKKATQGSVNGNGYELALATTKSDSSSRKVFFRINQSSNGDTYRINSTTVYPTNGIWMHVAATYDGTTMRLYINGVEESNLTLPAGTKIALNNVPLSIGAQGTPSRYFMGWMDDTRVYNRALSPEEIRAFLNHPPVVVDDAYDTPEDTLLEVPAPGVLANDTDADLDPLTTSKITDPAHGMLTLNNDGSFTYDPEEDWNGSDSFTYKARDTYIGSNTATVIIHVTPVNDAPVVTDIPDQVVSEGESFATISLDDYVSDVDSADALMTWTYSGNTDLTVSIVDRVATINVPDIDWNGAETITFRAADIGLLSDEDTATFTVCGRNDPPVLDPIGPRSTSELVPLLFTASAMDIDLPPDTLTYSLADGDNGSVPDGAGIGTTSGAFSWTPTEAQGPDSYTFDVCVSDGLLSDCETIPVTVNEVNAAPVAAPDAYDIVEKGILTVPAPGVLANDSDVDLPANNLSAILDTSTLHGTLILNPDGSFSYTRDILWSGIDIFTYRVYDGTSYSEPVSVTITVKFMIYFFSMVYKL